MILLVALAGALAAVVLRGGSFAPLREVRLHASYLAVVALGLQVVVVSVLPTELPATVARAVHVESYVLVVAFLLHNRHLPGIALVGAGTAANAVAIAANGGVMPASRAALAFAGRAATSAGFANSAAVAHPRLAPLGDVFALPAGLPLANVFSVGDVLLILGVHVLLQRTCVAPVRAASSAAPSRQAAGANWASNSSA